MEREEKRFHKDLNMAAQTVYDLHLEIFMISIWEHLDLQLRTFTISSREKDKVLIARLYANSWAPRLSFATCRGVLFVLLSEHILAPCGSTY
jgi:hypothetical protein